jgi:PAS domain S-box-containing protein
VATVLVVDDRASNRELARVILGYGGHRVIEAHEGVEALGLAHAQHPDLILTDVLMPGMDGYQLVRELRAAADTAQTPIVFYTANYLEAEARPFADACGVARVVLKSSDPQLLLQTIDDVLAEERVAGARIDAEEADREHLQAISAKLFEKSQALSDTEARFRLMANSSPVGIVFGDQHGSANYVNSRFTEIMKLPAGSLLDLGWLRCVSEEHHEEILTTVCAAGSRDVEHHYRSHVGLPDGTFRWLNAHIQAVREDDEHCGFIGTVDDVTTIVEADRQRRATERQHDVEAKNRATERLESLSRLAGGVAHDFNNILGVILAFENFVAESITELTAAGRLEAETSRILLGDLDQIRKGGQRATGLTQQLLTFGGRKVINLSPLDLNQAVRESNDMLAPTIGAHIQIITDLDPDLRPLLAEPTNVAQILLNVTLNACDAMPESGTLTMVTSNVAATQQVRLTIRDTGVGMAPEILERAIEPFFTTKGRRQGTGLGLATVFGIVNQLGGTLRIESVPGRGTVVTIHLPTTDQPVETPPSVPAPTGGTETILVAEDEDGIRDSVTRMLTKAGYTILAAADGAGALELAEQHPHLIQLLLSDVMMPGMLGNELATRLRKQRPETKVLFMSGYAGDLMSQQGILESGVTVLPKPFSENELLTAVRTMIGVSRT